MHIRKKDLFMGLIGLSMMLGSTFSPAQLSELVDELRTMRYERKMGNARIQIKNTGARAQGCWPLQEN